MAISVVIPVHNNWNLTHSLLLDIYRHLPQDTEVIVVDDCSTDEAVGSGLSWWGRTILSGRLTICTNPENVGFLTSCNLGVSNADTDVVILMNNDIKLKDDHIVEKVRSALRSTHPTLVGARMLVHDTGWNTFGGKIFPYLEGWFLAFHKKDWDNFGGFDTRYIPYDYEDVDLSTTYLHSGGEIVPINVDIVHLGGQSIKFSPERAAQTEKNKEKFRLKWLS